ncbi:MAG TPA: ParA family protein [Hyphomicrobiaceae bacterium]|nr:ParA family protein [Hyphomicrobiaceae bacterium]
MTPLVVAFVSQKGGVGKSTLARALATFAVRRGYRTRIADLDLQQKTILLWQANRERQCVEPAIEAASFASVQEAVAASADVDLLILDTAGKITDDTTDIVGHGHLLVQPTSPSPDDLHIAVLVFLAMERVKVPREKLAFALCRILAGPEEEQARSHLESFGYRVLEGSIHEQLQYREAMRIGRSIAETEQQQLDAAPQALMLDLLRTAAANAFKQRSDRREGRG